MFTLLDKTYIRVGALTVADWQGEGELEFVVEGFDAAAQFKGAALLLFTRDEGSEASTQAKIAATTALLRSQLGRNAAYDQCFQYVYESPRKVTVETTSIQGPRSFGIPLLDGEHLHRIEIVSTAIASAPPGLQRRAELALQWHFNANLESSVAGFVYRWVAIEVIGMPDSTNVTPANQLLSDAYGIPLDEARETFRLGRLQGIRADIVHAGVQRSVASEVLDYLDALFVDIFESTLGITPQRLAQACLTPTVIAFCDAPRRTH